MFKFFDREGNTLVLRPDVTPSIARCIAKYFNEENMGIRLSYAGNVFLNNSSYQLKLKETCQLGAELVNDASVQADTESIAMAIDCFLAAGLTDFRLSIGEVEFFNGLTQTIKDEEVKTQLRELILNKNYFGLMEYVETLDLSDKIKDVFLHFNELNGDVAILDQAFHGRTSLAVEATHNPSIIAPINNNGHVTYLPLNDMEAMKQELSKGDTCAVIIEGIQGVGGIKIPTTEFMQELRKACSETGTILILDEIQSGYGRSGKFFAHQYNDIKPDIITVAKGIGNGFPMAGVLISPMFKPVYGQLGTTFGGNHLACSAALAVMDVIEQENLVENAKAVGDYLLEELKKFPQIKEVRGRGLMIGLEFEEPIKELRSRLIYDEHVFTGASGTNVLRLLPPLCLSMEEAKEFLARFKKVL